MRDVNPRGRERFELSLDGRQIASIVVGSIVVLAVVFVLGLNVGKQLARSDRRPPASGDALAALDQPPVAQPPGAREEALTYHDRLVKERPAAAPAEPTRPAPEAQAAPPPPPPPPAPAEAAGEPPAEPTTAAPSPRPPPAASASAVRAVPAGDWCVQVGAASDREESERIASRFQRFSPRIETALVQGKTWYRVRVGAFETKGAAEKYLKDLTRETGAKGFVTSNH